MRRNLITSDNLRRLLARALLCSLALSTTCIAKPFFSEPPAQLEPVEGVTDLKCPGTGCTRLLANQANYASEADGSPPTQDIASANTEPLVPAKLSRVKYGASKETVFVELTPYGRSVLLARTMPPGSAVEVLNLRASVVRVSRQVSLTAQLLRIRKSAERTTSESNEWHDRIGGEVELGLQDGGYAKVGANWPVLRLPWMQVNLSTKAVVHSRSTKEPNAYVAMDVFEQHSSWRLSAEVPTPIRHTKLRLSRAVRKDWYALFAMERSKATLSLSLPL
jgi:hypothetical protein